VRERETTRIIEEKRERTRESECVREKEGGREGKKIKRVCSGVYISSSLMTISESLSSPTRS